MRSLKTPPGWYEPVSYWGYFWEELSMWGGLDGGYARTSRAVGAMRLAWQCLPRIYWARDLGLELTIWRWPTRDCAEGQLRTFGWRHGWLDVIE